MRCESLDHERSAYSLMPVRCRNKARRELILVKQGTKSHFCIKHLAGAMTFFADNNIEFTVGPILETPSARGAGTRGKG